MRCWDCRSNNPVLSTDEVVVLWSWAIHLTLCWPHNGYYCTSDSLWKIWLIESIQSIHDSLWTWHDKCNICCRYCIYHVKFNVAWLLSPLECSRQKQNGWTLCFCFWGWIMWKMYNKTNYWIRFSHDIMNYQNLVSVLSTEAEGWGR